MNPSVSRACVSNIRTIGVRSFGTTVVWTDMMQSKNKFVSFINNAVSNPNSPEGVQLHQFLVKCFVDNDSDYDGLVSYKGFNNMVQQAALAPRRFGFAPHTREMYSSVEEYETERTAVFNRLDSDGQGRITLESWLLWAKEHIAIKDDNLQEHEFSRWKRSKADFISFFKGVVKDSSTHCTKSSSSTQYKEFYILNNRIFVNCDTNRNGLLDEASFERLIGMNESISKRFGFNWYSNVKFSDVAVDGKVSWMNWFNYNLSLIKKETAAL